MRCVSSVSLAMSSLDRFCADALLWRANPTGMLCCVIATVFFFAVAGRCHPLLGSLAVWSTGDVVDQSLVKKVVDLFVEMGLSNTEVYSDELERPLLEATAAFYQRQSAQWVEDDSFPAFMLKAEACLAAEQARAAAYLVPRTKERLLRTVEHEVLVVHQQRMLDKDTSGLITLLVNDAREDLSRLFRLYARVADALQPIATTLKRHVHAEGMELVREQKARVEAASKTSSAAASAAADKPDFIQALLALHDRYTDLVSSCFGEHPTFTRALKEAFEVFVNQQVGKSSTAELFAGYCDELLRVKGAGARMSEEDVEEQLDKLVQLFAYLSDKDVFQEFSRKQLAKRLLMDRSHSDDAESFLITKLKERCGAHFTSKLEGMITDMTLSKDVQEAFQVWFANKASNMEDVSSPATGAAGAAEGGAAGAAPAAATGAAAAAGTPAPPASAAVAADVPAMAVAPVSSSGVRTNGLDFAVRVLTTGHWPTYAQDKITLPPELYQSEQVFREYYNTRTAQRVLRFVHALGKVWLTTTYYANGRWGGKVELACSTHQACVMMLFNDAESLTYGKICEMLGLDPAADVSKGTMLSLSTISGASGSKARAQQSQSVLLRAPAVAAGGAAGSGSSTHVGVNDVFSVNVKFSSQRPKLKLKPLHAKITDAEKEAAQSTVHEDRRHAVEAAIVRVMKQHKRMPHNQLVVQVSELLMPVFKPDPPLIRSRIDELITREYIKRDPDVHVYEYLA